MHCNAALTAQVVHVGVQCHRCAAASKFWAAILAAAPCLTVAACQAPPSLQHSKPAQMPTSYQASQYCQEFLDHSLDNSTIFLLQQSCSFKAKLILFIENHTPSIHPCLQGPNTSSTWFTCTVQVLNRPFPSSLVLLLQSESKCETILLKMTLTCMKMKLHAKLIFI